MPNALTHLRSAASLLADSTLTDSYPGLGESSSQAAFLLGSISPDVRVVTQRPREETHFFEIPFADDRPAQATMLARFPALESRHVSDAERRAFIAGYITHLVMDQVWVEEVVMGHLFMDGEVWGLQHPNWWLYSLLMTHMEYRADPDVSGEVWTLMRQATPHDGWLPFVADSDLIEWRNRVAYLMDQGGPRMVSWMFAKTNSMEPDELEEIILSPDRMRKEAFERVPESTIVAFLDSANRQSTSAVIEYLSQT